MPIRVCRGRLYTCSGVENNACKAWQSKVLCEALESRVLLSANYPMTPLPAVPLTPALTDATAIARWDTVPYQTFSSDLVAGVVAFHLNGIDRVDFSVNNGPWTSAPQMTLNPQTGVWEYCLPLHAADYPDGAIQIQAVAYPAGAGEPRVLAPLTLYADAQGTLPAQTLWVSTTGSDATGDGSQQNPFASIEKATEAATDGTSIELTAGTYDFTGRVIGYNYNPRWITLQPAPGLSRSDVTVRPDQLALRVYHLALHNLTVSCSLGADLYGWNDGPNAGDALWVDGCDIFSPLGQVQPTEIPAPLDQASWAQKFVTDTSIHDYPGRAMVGIDLTRGVHIYNIGDDAIDNPGMVVNTTIDNVIADNPVDHIDALQWWLGGGEANSIVYGVTATRVDGQLLFSDQGMSDLAVVNYLGVSLQGGLADPAASQFGKSTGTNVLHHLLFDHVTLPNEAFFFDDDTSNNVWSDSTVRNSVFWRLFATDGSTKTIQNCHVIDTSSFAPHFGDFTTGDAGFADPAAGDWRPAPGSPLLGRSLQPDVPADAHNLARTGPDDVGALIGVDPVPSGPGPTASAIALDVNVAGGTSEIITVTYSDPLGINAITLNGNNIFVTGPNGFSQSAALMLVDDPTNGSPRTATYQITAPSGTWDATDSGTYTVFLRGGQVADLSGNLTSPETIKVFAVNLDVPTPQPSPTPPPTPGLSPLPGETPLGTLPANKRSIATGSLAASGDEQLYSFTTAALARVTIRVLGQREKLRLELLDGNGVTLGTTAPGRSARQLVRLLAAGTYHLRVTLTGVHPTAFKLVVLPHNVPPHPTSRARPSATGFLSSVIYPGLPLAEG